MKIIELIQGSREWHGWRMQGIGASEIPALLDRSPFPKKNRTSLFAEKTIGVKEEPTEFQMKKGQWLEPVARKRYVGERGLSMRAVCCEHEEAEYLRASLDGINEHFGKFIEIKYSRPEWHLLAMMGQVPEHVNLQMQYQFLVTGYKIADFVSITDNETEFRRADMRFKIVPNRPDAELMANILIEAEKFWAEVLAWRERKPVVDPRETVASWNEKDEVLSVKN
jgi:putative phage-type endonuclease